VNVKEERERSGVLREIDEAPRSEGSPPWRDGGGGEELGPNGRTNSRKIRLLSSVRKEIKRVSSIGAAGATWRVCTHVNTREPSEYPHMPILSLSLSLSLSLRFSLSSVCLLRARWPTPTRHIEGFLDEPSRA